MFPEIRREAPAPAPNRSAGVRGRLAHAGMVGEAEVVVGAQQEDLGAVERHPRALRALDQPQAPVQPRLAQLLEAVGDVAHGATLVAPARRLSGG